MCWKKWRQHLSVKIGPRFQGFDILKTLVRRREMTLGEINEMLPQLFNDHKDFYVLANLISAGLVDSDMHELKDNVSERMKGMQTGELASTLYTMTLGKGDHKHARGTTINAIDYNGQVFFSTVKADFVLYKIKKERWDMILTLSVGIIIAIVSSILTAYFSHPENRFF